MCFGLFVGFRPWVRGHRRHDHFQGAGSCRCFEVCVASPLAFRVLLNGHVVPLTLDGLLQEAEVMKRMLTSEFMQLHREQSVLKNTKMFLGDRWVVVSEFARDPFSLLSCVNHPSGSQHP
jgi:hypothetical protein